MSEAKSREAAKLPGKPPHSELTRDQVREFLVALLRDVCQLPEDQIKDSSTLDRELEMESVQMVQVQVALEEEFNFTIDFLEVLRLNSFARIVDYIHDQVRQESAMS